MTKETIVKATPDMSASERHRMFMVAYNEEIDSRKLDRGVAMAAAKKRLGRLPAPSEVIVKDWPNGKGPSEPTIVKEVMEFINVEEN